MALPWEDWFESLLRSTGGQGPDPHFDDNYDMLKKNIVHLVAASSGIRLQGNNTDTASTTCVNDAVTGWFTRAMLFLMIHNWQISQNSTVVEMSSDVGWRLMWTHKKFDFLFIDVLASPLSFIFHLHSSHYTRTQPLILEFGFVLFGFSIFKIGFVLLVWTIFVLFI